jgi:hypothetical protein
MCSSSHFGRNALGLTVAMVFAVTLVAGCGRKEEKTSVVSGKVTIKGEGVAHGILTLHFENGQQSRITLTEDGSFKAGQIPLGQAKVSVTGFGGFAGMENLSAEQKEAKLKEVLNKKADKMPADKRVAMFKFGPSVPELYANPQTSGLTWEIKGPTEAKDFELK